MARTSVVLPAPFSPRTATTSVRDGQVDLVDDAVAVVGDAGARDGEHRPRVGVRVRMVVGHEQGCPSFTVWRSSPSR